ncbi:MAG: CAP domain-containing protein [archaeon]
MKNNKKILVLSLVIASIFLFTNIAKASTLSSLSSSLGGFISYINNNIIGQIKGDFCKQYILSISSGEWKADEFRTRLGKQVCTGYTVTASDKKVATTPVQTVSNNKPLPSFEDLIGDLTKNIYTPTTTLGSDIFPSQTGGELNSKQIISLTNTERKSNNASLVNLTENSLLDKLASLRAADMFSKTYFDHVSPSGDNISKMAQREGYSYATIGENIAKGNFGSSAGLVKAWMESTGHRANILNNKYTEIGVYASQGNFGGQTVWIAAQIFGKSLAGCKSPDADIKAKIEKYKVSAESLMTSIKGIQAEMKAIGSSDVDAYNAKAAEYNTYAGLYNNLAGEIKKLTAEYNAQVAAFNSCIQ